MIQIAIKNMLAEGYLEMNEEDILYGFYKIYSKLPETYTGFYYEKHGSFSKAIHLYSKVNAPDVTVENVFEEKALKNGHARYMIVAYLDREE